MGGLDARFMISHLDMAPQVATLTTLGTPHRGEWWSRMPIGPMRAAMRAGAFGVGLENDLAITSRADLIIRWNRATLDPPATRIERVLANEGRRPSNMRGSSS